VRSEAGELRIGLEPRQQIVRHCSDRVVTSKTLVEGLLLVGHRLSPQIPECLWEIHHKTSVAERFEGSNARRLRLYSSDREPPRSSAFGPLIPVAEQPALKSAKRSRGEIQSVKNGLEITDWLAERGGFELSLPLTRTAHSFKYL
jgi:hypothetical protein